MVGYYTVHTGDEKNFINWDWLLHQNPVAKTHLVRHLQFEQPLIIKMDGHKGKGIILKPEADFGKPR